MEKFPLCNLKTFDALRHTIRQDLSDSLTKITAEQYHHPNAIDGFKQRKSLRGDPSAKVWIIPVVYPVKLGDGADSNPWCNDPDFVSLANFILERLIEQSDQFKFPSRRRFFIAINYYEPNEKFDIYNPVFPWHTDFNIMTFLCSDGPTMIYEYPIEKWTEINLYADEPKYQIQFGSLTNILSKGKINAVPHGVGRSPVITNGQGKISIVGILDLDSDVEVEFVSSSGKTALITSAEYSRLRFKASYPSGAELQLAQIPEGTEAECSRLNDEPESREIYREFIAHLNVFPRPGANNIQ